MTRTHAGHPSTSLSSEGERAVLVVMAGVPGAGKSTAMQAVNRDLSRASPVAGRVRVLDSDTHRNWLAARLPAQTPYRWYRPLTHLVHQGRLVALVLAGPTPRGRRERPLLVHDPGTRSWWRAGVGRLARARGWQTCLVYLDVTRGEALRGQLARGRVLREDAFAGHWRRWEELRALVVAGRTGPAVTVWHGWQRVRMTTRDDVVATLLAELGNGSEPARSGAAADETPAQHHVVSLGTGAGVQRAGRRVDDNLRGLAGRAVQHEDIGKGVEGVAQVRELPRPRRGDRWQPCRVLNLYHPGTRAASGTGAAPDRHGDQVVG